MESFVAMIQPTARKSRPATPDEWSNNFRREQIKRKRQNNQGERG